MTKLLALILGVSLLALAACDQPQPYQFEHVTPLPSSNPAPATP